MIEPEINHDAYVEVILVGGPADLPENLRTQRVRRTDDKLKVPYQGGYEHFERSAGDDPSTLRWTTRTRVAE
jgi:hypothetical protein